jgi:cyclase
MRRERITEDVLLFTSEEYLQVTAGVVLTSVGGILVDTLLYPDETAGIRSFVQRRTGLDIVAVINTHHHVDHTLGTCQFSGLDVIAHEKCRAYLDHEGRQSMREFRSRMPGSDEIDVILPNITFSERMLLSVGGKTLEIASAPGHSDDMITCFVREEQVLFAGDAVMPVPYFARGSYADMVETLAQIAQGEYECIIQGHGEVILKGEIASKLRSDQEYLTRLYSAVRAAIARGEDSAPEQITLEACGKSRILLNGVAENMHRQNIRALVREMRNGL